MKLTPSVMIALGVLVVLVLAMRRRAMAAAGAVPSEPIAPRLIGPPVPKPISEASSRSNPLAGRTGLILPYNSGPPVASPAVGVYVPPASDVSPVQVADSRTGGVYTDPTGVVHTPAAPTWGDVTSGRYKSTGWQP